MAILPGAIFILRSVFLQHWLLTTFGVILTADISTLVAFNNWTEINEK